MPNNPDPRRARLARRRASITRQALLGFAVVLAGCAWGILVVRQVGEKALARDVSPLAGPLIVLGIGSIVMTIAAYRKMFMAPLAFLKDEAGDKVLDEIAELLD